jgi:hypothetical protein
MSSLVLTRLQTDWQANDGSWHEAAIEELPINVRFRG